MEDERFFANHPSLAHLHVFQIAGFISSCRQLRQSIHQGWREQGHSENLPLNVTEYLSNRLNLTEADIELCWAITQSEITKEGSHPLQNIIPALYATRESVEKLNALDLRKCRIPPHTITD